MRLNNTKLYALILSCSAFASCDDGRIEEQNFHISEEGRVLVLTGTFSGLQSWGDKYMVALAGYNDEDNYAEVTKALPTNQADGEKIEVMLSGIGEEVTQLRLCVIDRLRQPVVTFATVPDELIQSNADTLRLDVGAMDVNQYNTIQNQIFNNSCIACHGRSTFAAAKLFLTEGRSYDALQAHSNIAPAESLVVPGDAEASFIHKVLNQAGIIGHDHQDILSSKPELLKLLDNWIDAGARR